MVLLFSCSQDASREDNNETNPMSRKDFTLMTLDPGHFHAALVQKKMYEQIDPVVYVYAPEGQDVRDHLKRIDAFNSHVEDPTTWKEVVYTGPDFLEKMLEQKPGNVVVISGNNLKKTDYITKSIGAGLHVLADKPMVILPDQFPHLVEAFRLAEEKDVLLYDIMTERYEITTLLQKELSQIPDVFGALEKGSVDEPAITKESVHHFFKFVSGSPLIRPAWFFDVSQQGEGLVDVTTHLVDLTMWECFPGMIIDHQEEVEILEAKRWTTDLTPAEFEKVTGMKEFPGYLEKYVEDGHLKVYSNGEITYKLRDIHAKVSVTWNYQAPDGGDTHYSMMRGTRSNLIIRQGPEENFQPVLYVEPKTEMGDFEGAIQQAVDRTLQEEYPGVALEKISEKQYKVNIPDTYKVGHEAHFSQVTEKFLYYLEKGNIPAWEVPNMITKYYITTEALRMALDE
ncbi:MAG: Gfo/Idh/MocA family oxidoreductase [Cyclobacteriaceae bacterium]|nr:Gfo/Idh/MocA family oxidoreductase [Cyclobacteriaceae bacterium]